MEKNNSLEIYYHRIGAINFRTETNFNIPHIQKKPFSQFHVLDNHTDVSLHLKLINKKQLGLLAKNKFQESLKHSEKIQAILDTDQLIIRDFSRCKLDLICAEESGEKDPILSACAFKHRIAAYLKDVFSAFLPCFSAILIHSAGVVLNNKAAIFIADSTGGKSTVASQSEGAPVLSDDQVIISQNFGHFYAHATPFGRITNGPCSAKLGGLFLLEKDNAFKIVPLEPVAMLKNIWSSLLRQTYFLPKSLRTHIYTRLYDACHKTPTYTMHFPKDRIEWSAIKEALAQ